MDFEEFSEQLKAFDEACPLEDTAFALLAIHPNLQLFEDSFLKTSALMRNKSYPDVPQDASIERLTNIEGDKTLAFCITGHYNTKSFAEAILKQHNESIDIRFACIGWLKEEFVEGQGFRIETTEPEDPCKIDATYFFFDQ